MEGSEVPEKKEDSLVVAMEVVCVGTRSHKTVSVATAVDIDGTVHSSDDLRGLRAVDEEGADSRGSALFPARMALPVRVKGNSNREHL